MKRIFILLTVMLMTVGLFADEAVLIDFTKLARDIIPNDKSEEENKNTQNKATLMDYGAVAGGSFTEEQKGMMKTSLAIRNWTVRLNASARNVHREVLSYAEESPSKQYGTVMGIRINFPVEAWHSHAFIRPPFDIPAYDTDEVADDGTISKSGNSSAMARSRFEGPVKEDDGKTEYAYGVVKNVGVLKSVAVTVYGLNFPHALSVIIIDSDGNEKIYHVDYLNFDGWAELRWDNPQYVTQVRNRELRLYPLYPTSTPFIKFGGFVIKRDGDKIGGDFITYFRDVKVIYDRAVLTDDRDIYDEGIWHIINVREEAKKKFEMSRFGQTQILQHLEQQKIATENEFTESPKTQQ